MCISDFCNFVQSSWGSRRASIKCSSRSKGERIKEPTCTRREFGVTIRPNVMLYYLHIIKQCLWCLSKTSSSKICLLYKGSKAHTRPSNTFWSSCFSGQGLDMHRCPYSRQRIQSLSINNNPFRILWPHSPKSSRLGNKHEHKHRFNTRINKLPHQTILADI